MGTLRRVTINEVARQAGVSKQTVSRVINERPDVALETRRRVLEVIEQLGYNPSALARSLIQQRSCTLGVMAAGLKFIGPSQTLNGISAKAEELGYTLLLKELPRFETNHIQPLLQSLLSHQVDGVIWAVPEVGDNCKWIQTPDALPVPVVFLSAESQPGLTIVTVDNYRGGQIATRHLLDCGYQHIGHITGPLEWWAARERKRGWQDTLARAGLPAGETQWVEGNWSSASGEAAFRKLLTQYPEVDAVFVGNDQMALGALQVACSRGLKVPEQLGMVGFDDIAESAYFSPALTTISQDLQLVGSLAVEEAIRMIEGRRQQNAAVKPVTTVIQPELVIRASTTNVRQHN